MVANVRTDQKLRNSRVPTIFNDLDGTLLGHDDFGFRVIRDDILSFLERDAAALPRQIDAGTANPSV